MGPVVVYRRQPPLRSPHPVVPCQAQQPALGQMDGAQPPHQGPRTETRRPSGEEGARALQAGHRPVTCAPVTCCYTAAAPGGWIPKEVMKQKGEENTVANTGSYPPWKHTGGRGPETKVTFQAPQGRCRCVGASGSRRGARHGQQAPGARGHGGQMTWTSAPSNGGSAYRGRRGSRPRGGGCRFYTQDGRARAGGRLPAQDGRQARREDRAREVLGTEESHRARGSHSQGW